jgi:hypothetical protein
MTGHLPDNFGWHWQRWVELDNRGELLNEFKRSHLTKNEIDRQRAAGLISSASAMLFPQDEVV